MIIDMHAHVRETVADKRLLRSECRRNRIDVILISSLGRKTWESYPTDGAVRFGNASVRALANGIVLKSIIAGN